MLTSQLLCVYILIDYAFVDSQQPELPFHICVIRDFKVVSLTIQNKPGLTHVFGVFSVALNNGCPFATFSLLIVQLYSQLITTIKCEDIWDFVCCVL